MPRKDKEARAEYAKNYWQEYYAQNKERILTKNRKWAKDHPRNYIKRGEL